MTNVTKYKCNKTQTEQYINRTKCKTRKQFEYELNVKSTKQKLIKGAKRNPFEIVENLNSSNLVFCDFCI